MNEQANGVMPASLSPEQNAAEEQAAPHCAAVTRDGHPCRNRPVDGRRYCRVHAGLEAAEPAPGGDAETPIEIASERLTNELADVAAAVQELEIEIRNQAEANGADTGDGLEALRARFAAGAMRLIREYMPRMPAEAAGRVAKLVRENLTSDYLDPDFWRGIGMVLQYQVDELSNLIQRRMRGEYELDAFGMDTELVELVRPISSFLYRTYWRVDVEGLANVPDEGGALLVANHGGVLPWDSVMIATAVLEDHSSPRVVRTLYPASLRAVPGIQKALSTFGQVPDTPENAANLLTDGQLALVFPEGVAGLGKLFWQRYRLQRFRRSGSVGLAIRAGAPIVPVAVVGAEETYPMLADVRPLAEMLRLPFFPITPLFPLLGPLGLLPLPSKWSIAFGEPIATAEYGSDAADDPALVARVGEEVRARIQALLDQRLATRPSAFSR